MIRVLLTAATLAVAAPSIAVTMNFTGAAHNISGLPVVDATCAPLPKRVNVFAGETAGTSNLGDFTYAQNHCSTGGPGPYSGGSFSYAFAGDGFNGAYSGIASPSGTAGLLNNMINFVVTGGTGRFQNASGNFTGIGTVDFRRGGARQDLVLSGVLNLPAVPEPASWTLMIVGFGLSGMALRRRTNRVMA